MFPSTNTPSVVWTRHAEQSISGDEQCDSREVITVNYAHAHACLGHRKVFGNTQRNSGCFTYLCCWHGGDGILGHISPASLQEQSVQSREENRIDNTLVGLFYMFSGLEKFFMSWCSSRASFGTVGPVPLNSCRCEDRSRHGHRGPVPISEQVGSAATQSGREGGRCHHHCTHKLLGKMDFHQGME